MAKEYREKHPHASKPAINGAAARNAAGSNSLDHDVIKLYEDLSNFLLPTYSSSFLFNSRSITEDMVKFAKDSFNLIKNRNGRCFAADLNKWLAIHNVLKINKKMDSELSPCFDAAVNEAMYRHFRSKVFGPPARLSATLRQEIIDYLLDLDEDNDIKKYKTKMNTLAARETGAVGRMIEALVNLASQMTKVEKPVGEKKAESILESVWSYLFKVNMDYDPHHFDNSLFKKPHPLSLCRPDYAVEVESSPSFVNLVGEVKPCSSAADGVALDLYRLGIFSLALYEHYGMESVMSFQAKGLDVTFYVTHFYQGIYLMCELETIKFPSTMSEYCHFGALDALLNVSSVFEKRCIQQPQQPQQSQPTNFFPYIKMKCMYGLSTNKSQKSTEKAPSSFLS